MTQQNGRLGAALPDGDHGIRIGEGAHSTHQVIVTQQAKRKEHEAPQQQPRGGQRQARHDPGAALPGERRHTGVQRRE